MFTHTHQKLARFLSLSIGLAIAQKNKQDEKPNHSIHIFVYASAKLSLNFPRLFQYTNKTFLFLSLLYFSSSFPPQRNSNSNGKNITSLYEMKMNNTYVQKLNGT